MSNLEGYELVEYERQVYYAFVTNSFTLLDWQRSHPNMKLYLYKYGKVQFKIECSKLKKVTLWIEKRSIKV